MNGHCFDTMAYGSQMNWHAMLMYQAHQTFLPANQKPNRPTAVSVMLHQMLTPLFTTSPAMHRNEYI